MTTNKITVLPDSEYAHFTDSIHTAAEATLDQQGIESGELTLVLTDETQMMLLNLQFAGLEESTDVLSFESMEPNPESGLLYYGDVIIAVPIAEKQAAAAGHSLEDELRLLTIHGVLHILSHDHSQVEQREIMWSAQRAILERLGSNAAMPGAS